MPILVGFQPRTAALTVDALLEKRRLQVELRRTGLTIMSLGSGGAFLSQFLTDIDPIRGINVGLDVTRFDDAPPHQNGIRGPSSEELVRFVAGVFPGFRTKIAGGRNSAARDWREAKLAHELVHQLEVFVRKNAVSHDGPIVPRKLLP